MPVDVVIPDLGESITEAVIASWLRNNGDQVAADEPIAELETDKATVELPSPAAGVLNITAAAGSIVAIGDIIARIEPAAATGPKPVAAKPAAVKATQMSEPSEAAESRVSIAPQPAATAEAGEIILSPAARRLIEEHGLDTGVIAATGKGGRITKADVLAHLDSTADPAQAPSPEPTAAASIPAADVFARPAAGSAPGPSDGRRSTLSPGLALIRSGKSSVAVKPAAADTASHDRPDEERVAMTPIRRTIASRLLNAQATAAILTTFNEIDMSAVMALRSRYKQDFADTHGVSLGFMSFFARACVLACSDVPSVNARIEGDEIVYSNRVHLGIAASTPKGLVVPVVKGADAMNLAELEREIARLGGLARESKLSMADMSGGTFTISNGGVFGSLMSTPILNPPQSGILGMHKIEKRAVVIDDEIVIRPMMYVALSYDHRLVDGREAVTFLVRIKERIEDPERMLLGV